MLIVSDIIFVLKNIIVREGVGGQGRDSDTLNIISILFFRGNEYRYFLRINVDKIKCVEKIFEKDKEQKEQIKIFMINLVFFVFLF